MAHTAFKRVLAAAVLLLSFSPTLKADVATEVAPGQPRSGWNFSDAGSIPVQSGGRVKPLDSFAREVVLFETGSRSFQGWDPVDLLFSWISSPQTWEKREFIQVSREDVRKELLLDTNRTRFSPEELFQNTALLQYAQHMGGQSTVAPPMGGKPKEDPREAEMKRLLERLALFRNVVSGDAWPVIPMPDGKTWLPLAPPVAPGASQAEIAHAKAAEPKSAEIIRNDFVQLVTAYRASDRAQFERSVPITRAAVEGEIQGWNGSQSGKISAELIFNRARPFLAAWILYLTAVLLWIGALACAPGTSGRKWFSRVALPVNIAAYLAQITGFGLRCYIAGRPPVTNMYESVVWVSLGIVTFAFILYAIHKQQLLLAIGSSLATLLLIVADSAPAILDPSIHPLVPVLRSNYWLTIHVLTITLGYAAFALTLGISNVTLFQYIRGNPPAARVASLNQLNYRAMQFGVALLAAGTILGGVWADYSWGRFWGWDPKEVWALIALLCYLAILHGRYAGWVTQFAFAATSVCAFLSVLMAWYGVNFVLGVGLHSYGFSTGGRGAVMTFVALQLGYVMLAVFLHRARGRGGQRLSSAEG